MTTRNRGPASDRGEARRTSSNGKPVSGYVYHGTDSASWAEYMAQNRKANDAYDTDRIVNHGGGGSTRWPCDRDSIDRRYGSSSKADEI